MTDKSKKNKSIKLPDKKIKVSRSKKRLYQQTEEPAAKAKTASAKSKKKASARTGPVKEEQKGKENAPKTGQDSAKTKEVHTPQAAASEGLGVEDKAQDIVKNNVILAMGFASVPVPIFDLLSIGTIQLKMLREISNVYGVPFSENIGKSVIAAFAGGGTSVIAGKGIYLGFLKLLPVAGHFMGAASISFMGGSSTYALGKVFIQHFETGGTMLNFDPQAMREHFEKELREGKSKVKAGL